MTTVFLTLGEVTFENFEIPSHINFGGRQSLAVKQLVGGQRIVDSMGRVDDAITWAGMFFGSTATYRARFLDGMRVAGAQLPLFYDQFNYLVIIRHFRARFERYYQIPYVITCEVVQDLNQPFPVLLPVAYDDAVNTLMAEAIDVANATANPNVINSIALLSESINEVGSVQNATEAELATIAGPLNSAINVTQSTINSVNQGLFG